MFELYVAMRPRLVVRMPSMFGRGFSDPLDYQVFHSMLHRVARSVLYFLPLSISKA